MDSLHCPRLCAYPHRSIARCAGAIRIFGQLVIESAHDQSIQFLFVFDFFPLRRCLDWSGENRRINSKGAKMANYCCPGCGSEEFEYLGSNAGDIGRGETIIEDYECLQCGAFAQVPRYSYSAGFIHIDETSALESASAGSQIGLDSSGDIPF
jgi:hypothetical protein